MDRYNILKTLGDGSFGTVMMAEMTGTAEKVAIKKMKKKYLSWDECLQLREVKSLKKLVHVNIIKLRELLRENDELFFIFDFMEGDLFKLMQSVKDGRSKRTFSENEIRHLSIQILDGLCFMHRHGFFHRDMKPENLLIEKMPSDISVSDSVMNVVLKIADFGLAREIRSMPPYTDYVSTRWYRAPEVLLRSTSYSSPIDIWGIGAILFELYAFRPMFAGSSEIDQLFKICQIFGTPLNNLNQSSDGLKSALSGEEWTDGWMLAGKMGFKFPHCVPTPLTELLPTANRDAVSLISEMMRWDPSRRLTAQAALNHPFYSSSAVRSKPQTPSQTIFFSSDQGVLPDSIKSKSNANIFQPSPLNTLSTQQDSFSLSSKRPSVVGAEKTFPTYSSVMSKKQELQPDNSPSAGKPSTWLSKDKASTDINVQIPQKKKSNAIDDDLSFLINQVSRELGVSSPSPTPQPEYNIAKTASPSIAPLSTTLQTTSNNPKRPSNSAGSGSTGGAFAGIRKLFGGGGGSSNNCNETQIPERNTGKQRQTSRPNWLASDTQKFKSQSHGKATRIPTVGEARQFIQMLPSTSTGTNVANVQLHTFDQYPQIVQITVDNRRKHNAFTPAMMLQMADIVTELSTAQHNQDKSALILTGSNSSFCAGLDLSEARKHLSTPEAGLMMCTLMQDTLARLKALPLISFALIDGWAIGGGAELATACDFRVWTGQSKMQFVQLKMGTSTGWGAGGRLVQLIGQRQTLRLLAIMPRLNVELAQEWGLCDYRIPDNTQSITEYTAENIIRKYLYRQRDIETEEMNDCQTLRNIKEMVHQVSMEGGNVSKQQLIERKAFGQLWGRGANLAAISC